MVTSLPLEGLCILAVDDDPDSLLLLTVILESQGAKVIPVASAHTALEAVRLERPDLLISDIGMPEEDGLVLIRNIRALNKAQGGAIPAIALSALEPELCQPQCLAAGFQHYVAKPVDPEDLIAIILDIQTLPSKRLQSFDSKLQSVA
ncbi:response regulator [Cyanobacteria bacterium FACHB-DQ100]|nr:response regulator [Cyanobacteria bacterium FACHB-DQ100]